MFKMKFPTKRIFRIFHILRINGMAPFCNLFMERPSYNNNTQINLTYSYLRKYDRVNLIESQSLFADPASGPSQ